MLSIQELSSSSVVHSYPKTKGINYLFFGFLLVTLVFILLFPEIYRKINFETLKLWVTVIIPSIVPMYIISSLLFSYPFLSSFFYPILRKIMHFESERSCSLFLLSLLTGQPTISILIHKAVQNQEISIHEGNRLMRFTSHLSPLYIIAIARLGSFTVPNLAWYIIGTQVLTSITIASLSKGGKKLVQSKPSDHSQMEEIFKIIDHCPTVLLNILMIMLIVTLFKFPFLKILTDTEQYGFRYLIDLFEITTGINQIIKYQAPEIVKILLITFALSMGGFSIELQVLYSIKKTRLKMGNYLWYRLIHGIIASTLNLVILLFIFLL